MDLHNIVPKTLQIKLHQPYNYDTKEKLHNRFQNQILKKVNKLIH